MHATPRKPRKKASPQKKKVAKHVEMPLWSYYALMGLMVVVFITVFYYFFIRPYAYRWKPCYGMKAYGICMPLGYRVHGIDISHHQDKVNWKLLSQARKGNAPLRFIFMKATEGGDFSDKQFVANFDSARANGFIRGAYHLCFLQVQEPLSERFRFRLLSLLDSPLLCRLRAL